MVIRDDGITASRRGTWRRSERRRRVTEGGGAARAGEAADATAPDGADLRPSVVVLVDAVSKAILGWQILAAPQDPADRVGCPMRRDHASPSQTRPS